jgi:hypothetical protein
MSLSGGALDIRAKRRGREATASSSAGEDGRMINARPLERSTRQRSAAAMNDITSIKILKAANPLMIFM